MAANICTGKHKARLFIGEGNFTYTEAFIKKHDEKFEHGADKSLAHSITATELVSEIGNECSECETERARRELFRLALSSDESEDSEAPTQLCENCSATIERIKSLQGQRVTIVLGVNAISMSTHPAFKDRKFSRIHWNCPHDGSNYHEQTLPEAILKFFKECSKMQNTGDRVHITLAQPVSKKGFYQGYVYNIPAAARATGYTLVKKRKFETDRYPGYQHTQTRSSSKASVTDQGMREFIFEKVSREAFKQIIKAARTPKGVRTQPLLEGLAGHSDKKQSFNFNTFYEKGRFYYNCSSDEDSSDCGE